MGRGVRHRPEPRRSVVAAIPGAFADRVAGGLVDEYRLITYLVVVGAGQRLLDVEGTTTLDLYVLDATPLACGVVVLRYQPS